MDDNVGFCINCRTAFQMDNYIVSELAKYCNICDSLINPPASLPINVLREKILKAIVNDEILFNKELEKASDNFYFQFGSSEDANILKIAFSSGAKWAKNRKPHLGEYSG